ncbi:FtsX-like permease family protein [Actinocorallia longicatena]|uniref:FtsX-like permease family protein n=1 Tax=Actinocorallia longicatena TaxID=111803 RepID=A0ABP6PZC5_9ACTN
MSGYRAALRIARRDATRSKGRSALVLAMIGVPVLAIVVLAVLARTVDLTDAERLGWDMGRADAIVQAQGREAVPAAVLGFDYGTRPAGRGEPWTDAEVTGVLKARLGEQTGVLPSRTGGALVTVPGGLSYAMVREVDLRENAARGLLRIDGGRPPATTGEVMVSRTLRERGFRIGTDLRTRDGAAKRIVGYVTLPDNPRGEFVQGLPGSLLRGVPANFLVTRGSPVTWADVRALNALGIAVNSRSVIERPPAGVPERAGVMESGGSGADTAIVALVLAMIILEVTLLAGPAFAVGIRRQRRLLALVAAVGGEARHLRAVVLASGAVLGVAAGALGTLGGFGGALIGKILIERYANTILPAWDIPWTWIAAICLLAGFSGLAAAYLPARQAARTDVVAALAGRRDEARTARGLPVAGGVLTATGLAATAVGIGPLHEGGAVIGTVLIVVGFVLLTPAAVGLAGRLARHLPLPARLAVRDADRNRGRTAPAVAAIMAAVAGITVLAIGGNSDFAQRRAEYVPRMPMGSTVVEELPRERVEQTAAAIRSVVPGADVVRADHFTDPLRGVEDPARAVVKRLNTPEPDPSTCDPVCAYTTSGQFGFEYLIGGPELGRVVLGRDDPAVTAALGAGRAVVFVPGVVRDGTARFSVDEFGAGAGTAPKSVPFPVEAVYVPAISGPTAILPPAMAARTGLATEPAGLFVTDRLTAEQTRQVREAVIKVAWYTKVYTERGFHESFGLILLILGAVGSIMVLGGSLIATGLSAADARPDLATLAAIGARPRTRRLLLMAQAGFVALLGCWLGITAGLAPGVAVAVPLTEPTDPSFDHGTIVSIPWALLTGVGVGVPLLAVLVIGATTRSRLPMVRRLSG